MASLSTIPAALRDRVTAATPATLADAGPALASAALASGASDSGAFRAAAALRAASGELARAARDEAGAEAATAALQLRFRATQELLVAAVDRARAASLDPATRAALTDGVTRWLDPYAIDAAGEAVLAPWADALRALPAIHQRDLEPVLQAIAAAREAGRAWDRADPRRAAAIASRVATQRSWVAALEALVTQVGPGGWLEALPLGAPAIDPTDDWFAD
jgi:hypothetical protein